VFWSISLITHEKALVMYVPFFQRCRRAFTFAILACCMLASGIAYAAENPPLRPQVYTIAPGPEVQYELQGRLIEAVPGDVIQLEEGRYELKRQLDMAADNLTIRGRGSEKTILSFEGQVSGSQGIEATGNNLVFEGFAVEDTAGNAIKVLGARNVTFRDVRAEWTGEAKASNGAYGIYPVQCENVLVEHCTVIGSSDAGVYVGQSKNAVVRSCRAERNVAGIEIENTIGADVYDNVTTNNAGGILVFDLPGLQIKAGRNVRLFRNKVTANNHANFAAPGNIVATVPPGTGIMILATDRVEVFENEIADNQSANLAIVSYLITELPFDADEFDAISDGLFVHDNRFSGGGDKPSGEMGVLLTPLVGKPFPDILFDGAV
jgi:parallel beta-helix repeat protein